MGPGICFLVHVEMAVLPPFLAEAIVGKDGAVGAVILLEVAILLLEALQDFGVAGILMNAFHLLWVLLVVEELPFLVFRNVEERVALGAHAVVGGHPVRALAIVGIVDRIAPVRGPFSAVPEEWDDTVALHIGGSLGAADVQKGRAIVDVLDEGLGLGAGLDHAGPTDDEGHLEALLEHPALVIPPVLTEVESLVA